MTRQLRQILALGLAVSLLAAGCALARGATVVRTDKLVLRLNGHVTPKKLPERRMAPITLRASGRVRTTDGSQPPPIRRVRIDFDKHGGIDAKGLPVCHARQLQSRDTKAVRRICRKAIVGKGRTAVRVALAESKPFVAHGPLLLFNGGVHHGVTTMYIHAYVSVPVPTAIVTVVRIRRVHKGPYGTRAIARIPRIASGAGSVTSFAFKIHRTFKRHGKRQSYLVARCANHRFRAHAVLRAEDGTRLAGSIIRPCRQR